MKRLLRTMSSKPKILVSKSEIEHFLSVYRPDPHPVVLKRCEEAIDNPRSLKNLNLSNQNINDDDAIKLFRALSKVHLFRRIDLSGNKLTERALIAFEKLLRRQIHVARHSTDCHHCEKVVSFRESEHRHHVENTTSNPKNTVERSTCPKCSRPIHKVKTMVRVILHALNNKGSKLRSSNHRHRFITS